MSKSMKVAVIGSGYVGLVAAVCFAEIGHEVICIDNDESKVQALQGGDSLIHEEYLTELLDRYRNKAVTFTTNLADATKACDVVFIAVGTPQSETGDADLSYVESVTSEIARSITKYTVLVEKSTVPVYTNEWVTRTLQRNGVKRELFDVVSNPEFLREGTAVSDFLHPDRIVVGSDSKRAADLLEALYLPLTSGEYYNRIDAIGGHCSAAAPPQLLLTSTKSAEIIKHASNAYLAMKISFINSVANLCEATDANVEQVARGIGLDARIGPRFLSPGIGYGGSCFPKDVAAFRSVAEHLGLDFGLLKEVQKVNELQLQRFFAKVRSAMWTLRGKKLAVLGLAFKGGTDDIRDSPAIELVKMLLAEGCVVTAYDPAATTRAKAVLPPSHEMRYAADAYEAASGADALLVLTDWKDFAHLDLDKLGKVMQYPTVVDGRNIFDPEKMAAHGFHYLSIGRPGVYPERIQ
ncbi:MAG: UDP-glucose/GDP-mannose dehydrogenase family protein [Acidobacteria bacterium]|nr:UDP-glucose/GDP-mannose dehydrogenase family protein [Acidobacteriota bacterium]